MHPGPPRTPLALLAGAGALALAAALFLLLAAPAQAAIVEMNIPAIRSENSIEDVYVDAERPDENLDEGDGSNFLEVRADPDTPARVFVKFPIGQIPRNVTIREASFTLTAETLTTDRTLQVQELLAPWDEEQLTWNNHALLGRSAPVNNLTTEALTPVPNLPNSGLTQATVFENAPNEPLGSAGITHSFRRFYLGEKPYHGHIILDANEDETPAGSTSVTQRFFSASGENAEGLRPVMTVWFDNNAPEFRDLKVDGQLKVNASSTRPVNISYLVFDNMGSIIEAWVNATTMEGREVFNKTVFQNRTSEIVSLLQHTVWTNESLGLPEGDYILNAWALDNDNNLAGTRFLQANITIENGLPFVNDTAVSHTRRDEGQPFTVTTRAEDRSGIASASVEVVQRGEVVANLSMRPGSDTDDTGNGTWELTHEALWAGDLNLTVWVADTAGNLNRSGVFFMNVRDALPPRILSARVVAPGQGPEGAFQEEGGRVAWEVEARDASPLTVVLEINPPSGGIETAAMVNLPGTERWEFGRNFTGRGSYAVTVVVTDLEGNRVSRGGLGFVLLDGAPPTFSGVEPGDGAWARGAQRLRAVVHDLNLDPGSLRMEVRVPPEPFLPAETTTSFLTPTSRSVQTTERFFHDQTVEVRAHAADALGRASSHSWSFRVDAVPPVTFVTPVGAFIADERIALTGATTLRIEREDEGSGVLATVLAVLNEDAGLRSPNVTLSGDAAATLNLSASPVYRGTGNYTLFVSTVDVAGNVEAVQPHRFLVDDSPPHVEVAFEPGMLTATVQERGAGLKEVRARYWISPSGEQGETAMSPADGSRTRWQARIPDAPRGTQVLYAVAAEDLLGNVGTAGTEAQPLQSVVQNHRPVVTVDPANGSLVRGTITITWSVVDSDGDPIETRVTVRPSTSDRVRELVPRRGAQGSVPWDTAEAGDGVWEVAVTARDGFDEVTTRSMVEVTNTGSRLVSVGATPSEPGQPVVIEAALYTPVERAQAVVRLRGVEVATVPLQDTGAGSDKRARDGVFSGQFLAAEAGRYRVDVEVLFTDGRLETRDEAAMVQVQFAFPARILHEPLLLAVLLGVPMAAAGVWLWRRYGPVRPG